MNEFKIFVLVLGLGMCNASSPGPLIFATKGAVWPKPQQHNTSDSFFILRPRIFKFNVSTVHSSCNFLENSLARYWKLLQFDVTLKKYQQKNKKSEQVDGLMYLEYLDVNLTGQCDDQAFPGIKMDESYRLWLLPNRKELQAASIWGILRGLETFSHLVYKSDNGQSLRLNATMIKDFPRYKHRGLLIDTSRHFIPLDKIFLTLDAMSYNKMNVLHWHIVDDQSFPYVSTKFPELSDKGAYNRYTKVYFPEDIRDVIEYARLRGIRVLPEFDSPGHTSSWGLSHPEILTSCEILNIYGPMDPSKEDTFTFLNQLFSDVRDSFKDDFFHLGGDEVDFLCWKADPNITEFMKMQHINSYEDLESYYVQRVVDMVAKLNFKSIVWEEVFENDVKLPNDTLVHVWKMNWNDTIKKVTASGKYALLSSCWYLDKLESGGDWRDFYLCDPTDFDGVPAQQELVLGGEACMWGETVNEYNIISRVWPRACTTAEKLWSANLGKHDLIEPAQRLEEHTCRMNRRGIGAQPPNGAGYCD
ncbi:beta-hexosaminidase subunit alpha-like isoform X2 [Euwallacea similis]|uniref:beta-hexosaminidase subunit alpha-like isoform X2 n=1 Tax=Euwallacea similis TaxID=1736056 RepID=UPI00344DE31E